MQGSPDGEPKRPRKARQHGEDEGAQAAAPAPCPKIMSTCLAHIAGLFREAPGVQIESRPLSSIVVEGPHGVSSRIGEDTLGDQGSA